MSKFEVVATKPKQSEAATLFVSAPLHHNEAVAEMVRLLPLYGVIEIKSAGVNARDNSRMRASR